MDKEAGYQQQIVITFIIKIKLIKYNDLIRNNQ